MLQLLPLGAGGPRQVGMALNFKAPDSQALSMYFELGRWSLDRAYARFYPSQKIFCLWF